MIRRRGSVDLGVDPGEEVRDLGEDGREVGVTATLGPGEEAHNLAAADERCSVVSLRYFQQKKKGRGLPKVKSVPEIMVLKLHQF
jgi:hypothetical protein